MILFDKRELKILPWLTGAKFFLIAMVLTSIFVTSCDESSVVGLDVQPTNDLLNVSNQDTTTLVTKTVKMDSLRTDETILQLVTTDVLLGTYIDPIFGRSSASIYTQLKLNTENPGFGINPILDSAVLSLVYDSSYCYGETERVAQNISVFKVFEDIKAEDKYYSFNSLSTSTFDLASGYAFIPEPTKSVTIQGEALKPQLRIKLIQLGQGILNNQGTGNLDNNAAFQKFIKGFYITTENTSSLNSGEGNILRFNLEDSQSKLTLYYRNDTEDSLKYDLSMNSVARFSRFTHDFTSVDVNLASQLSVSPPTQNDVVFVQSMSGLKVKIEIPYIMGWNKASTTTINKAELVIKVNPNATYKLDIFTAPEKLMLYGISDDGSDYVLPDFYEGSSYFGGVYNLTTQEYRINISRYIQQVLTGERKNNGLHLLALNGAINANRAVIGGGGSGAGAYQMKLKITHTKIP